MADTISSLHHLYWRAGFGLSPQEWTKRQNWSIDQAIDDLFTQVQRSKPLAKVDSPSLGSMMSAESRAEARKKERKLVGSINYAWLMRMASREESPLLERMTLFWHGHFACESKTGALAVGQLNTLRKHALGNFRDLILAVAQDPAMIRYLNNQQNRKFKPNENFARELMELFTIGRGNYTEQDIKEAARAFTGWSSDRENNYVFRTRLHDYGEKTFMGQTGNFNGEDIVDIILQKKETADFICRKIYRYFVNEQVDETNVQSLSNSFYKSNYDLDKLMRDLFSSNWFYAPENRGNKIKSPIEFLAGMVRQLGISKVNLQSAINFQRALGQVLFRPPNVAGWPGGKSWIDNSTLLLRLNLPAAILKAAELDFQLSPELEQEQKRQLKRLDVSLSLAPLAELLAGDKPTGHYQQLAQYLLQAPAPPTPALLKGIRKTDQAMMSRMMVRIMTLPEYQLC
ncbi:MAG: DUF1800 domain-containing protein [Bacteroidota bacterium]